MTGFSFLCELSLSSKPQDSPTLKTASKFGKGIEIWLNMHIYVESMCLLKSSFFIRLISYNKEPITFK